ncbi:hypothetical protein AX16_010123 [Volvariella volvacea WC 439]|nr:hypothetical protein AX16_010123 [Volvariella volvacea WC 439]
MPFPVTPAMNMYNNGADIQWNTGESVGFWDLKTGVKYTVERGTSSNTDRIVESMTAEREMRRVKRERNRLYKTIDHLKRERESLNRELQSLSDELQSLDSELERLSEELQPKLGEQQQGNSIDTASS